MAEPIKGRLEAAIRQVWKASEVFYDSKVDSLRVKAGGKNELVLRIHHRGDEFPDEFIVDYRGGREE